MKIKDLLNIEKSIAEKNIELEEQKQELEKLRLEAEKLKLTIEINNAKNQDDMIDISNIYLYREIKSDVVLFIKRIENVNGYKLIDIFSNKHVRYCDRFEFIDAKFAKAFDFSIEHIKEVYPEVLAYPNGLVPKLLLQKLYYEANNIDEKVLQKALMKD